MTAAHLRRRVLVVVAKSSEELRLFDLTNVIGHVDELVLLNNQNSQFGGLGSIGNHYMDTSDCDTFGFVHADTYFGPEALSSFFNATAKGAVAGMIGRLSNGQYLWSRDDQNMGVAGGPRLVSILDGCSVFLRRETGLRFDTDNFDTFHCCIEDLCLQARAKGRHIVVPHAQGYHVGASSSDVQWRSEFHRYREKLQHKWGDLLKVTT